MIFWPGCVLVRVFADPDRYLWSFRKARTHNENTCVTVNSVETAGAWDGLSNDFMHQDGGALCVSVSIIAVALVGLWWFSSGRFECLKRILMLFKVWVLLGTFHYNISGYVWFSWLQCIQDCRLLWRWHLRRVLVPLFMTVGDFGESVWHQVYPVMSVKLNYFFYGTIMGHWVVNYKKKYSVTDYLPKDIIQTEFKKATICASDSMVRHNFFQRMLVEWRLDFIVQCCTSLTLISNIKASTLNSKNKVTQNPKVKLRIRKICDVCHF